MSHGFDVFIINREYMEAILSKVTDLATGVQKLAASVADAVVILNTPLPPPGDDPAIQPLIDQVDTSSSDLAAAVTAYRAAHPTP